ncbi:hypothetical protein QYF50_06520 [Paenibacillus vini]|uniref:hypothetical protein n=1 Tax=Paenibacillus vini TaxID=1476024 RepID=UPI0025B720A1|nr:hypothetical protein [Paenibacillus vini]MDN4067545.1 hypothetical protein [Paenibacillus vini]
MAWSKVPHYRFGQFIQVVCQNYRQLAFGQERIPYLEYLSDAEWRRILNLCGHDPIVNNSFSAPDKDAIESPARITRIIGALNQYWLQYPNKKLGQLISDLADTFDSSIYQAPDDCWISWLSGKESSNLPVFS